jgi:hypothetical protein
LVVPREQNSEKISLRFYEIPEGVCPAATILQILFLIPTLLLFPHILPIKMIYFVSEHMRLKEDAII